MQFFANYAFICLWTIPLVIVLFWISNRIWKNRLKKLGDVETIQGKLIPSYRKHENKVRLFYIILTFLFLTLALARPQWGDEQMKIQRKGVDIIFMIDTSLSMLAEDIKPSRFVKAKMEIKTFLRQLKGDRVGMVAFAGSSFLQTPLTLDSAAFQLFLDAVDIGYVPDPGTSIDRAIRLAVRAFPKETLKHKAIVLFSDGEDHEGGFEEGIKVAKEAGVRIYTIGTGTPDGEPIPLKSDRGEKMGFKKDRSGQIVITKLNAETLQKIAEETGGVYLPSTPAEQEVDLILKHMETLGQKQFKERLVTAKEDHYQIFLFFAFLFLVFETLMRRTSKKTKKKSAETLVVLLMFFVFSGFINTTSSLNKKANELYEEKKYQSALDELRKAKVKNPDNAALNYNLGTTLYKVDEYKEAAGELQKSVESIESIEDPLIKSQVYYNYGNAQYRMGDFEGAIESYQKALEHNPKDEDAKYNLEFIQKQKSTFDSKNDKKQDENKKDNQKQDKNEDQNQDQNQNQKSDQQKQDQDQQDQQKNQDQQDQKQDQNQDQQKQDQQQNQDNQENSENQQNNPQDGEQEEQDKNSEGQGQDSDQNKEERKDQPSHSNQQGEDEQDQKDQQKQEDPQQNQQGQDQEDQDSSERPEPEQQDNQQNAKQDEADQQETPHGGGGRMQQAPLQGQMTQENALRILEALKEGEQELLDARRPKGDPSDYPQVLKDW